MFNLPGMLFLAMTAVALRAGPRVLDFTAVIGETNHHPEAMTESQTVLDGLAKDRQWTLVHSKDPALFTDTGLGRFDVILINNTGGNVFNAAQKKALESFIRKGGGMAGIHAATFMHKVPGEWPWWEDLIGKLHVSGPPARGYVGAGANTILMQDTSKLFAEGIPKQWVMQEVEWYKYNRDLPGTVHVLATAEAHKDMAGYPAYYPVSWCQHFDGGRSWYTNMGHFASEFRNANFLVHLQVGIEWAALGKTGGCGEDAPPVVIGRPQGRWMAPRNAAGLTDLESATLFNALGIRKRAGKGMGRSLMAIPKD